MSKKSKRLEIIRSLIETEALSSQEELLERLREMEIDATQSTLSRDMKELKAVKIPDEEKGYVYVLPDTIRNDRENSRAAASVSDNITEVGFSGNIAVIKTRPGFANAVAILIDSVTHDDIMGTIAGDDNIFILMKEGTPRERILDALKIVCPHVGSLLFS